MNTAIIRIVDPLPAGRDHDAVDTHQRDAAAIVDALWATLPGATIDRVVAQMLERTAGRLRVPHQRAGDR